MVSEACVCADRWTRVVRTSVKCRLYMAVIRRYLEHEFATSMGVVAILLDDYLPNLD